MLQHDTNQSIPPQIRLPSQYLRKVIPAAMITMLCSACSVMPSQVARPTIKPAGSAERAAGLKAQYILNGNSVIYDQAFDTSPSILPVETTVNGVQSQALALKGAYLDRQRYLLGEIDVINNFQFAGILVSAIGVATKSNAWRNSGAGAAGLSSLWGSHYSLAVQAANYGLAAEAMDCLSTEISTIPPSFWRVAYETEGVFTSARAELVLPGLDEADTAKAYDALTGMFESLHASVSRIDLKLRSLQGKVVISTVTVADIQDAAAGKAAAKKGADLIDSKLVTDKAISQATAAQNEANQAEQNVADTANKLTEAKRAASLETDKFSKTVAQTPASATPAETKVRIEAAALLKEKADLLVSQLEVALKNRQDKASATRTEASDKKSLASLLKLGVVGRASQVPANVHACVVAMGK